MEGTIDAKQRVINHRPQPSQSPTLPFPIPPIILLLIHLHLLSAPFLEPQKDGTLSQYDFNMFNPDHRTVDQRTKCMQDIVFFLVGQIEGREQCNALYPMYPCNEAADNVMFRQTTLKYLEETRSQTVAPVSQAPASRKVISPVPSPVTGSSQTRKPSVPLQGSKAHPSSTAASRTVNKSRIVSTSSVVSRASSSTRPSSSASVARPSSRTATTRLGNSTSNRIKSKPPLPSVSNANPKAPASSNSLGPQWWWKTLSVNEPVLESCAGQDFEHTLLVLSIHSLMIKIKVLESEKLPDSSSELIRRLTELPQEYSQLLNQTMIVQEQLSKQNSILESHMNRLRDAKVRIQQQNDSSTKISFSVDRLNAILDTKMMDLTSGRDAPWLSSRSSQLPSGDEMLNLLFKLAGATTNNDSSSDSGKNALEPIQLHYETRRHSIVSAQPLPISAAHHPKYINSITESGRTVCKDLTSKEKSQKTGGNIQSISTFFSSLKDEVLSFNSAILDLESELSTLDEERTRLLAEEQANWESTNQDDLGSSYGTIGNKDIEALLQPLDFNMPAAVSRNDLHSAVRAFEGLDVSLGFEGDVDRVREFIRPSISDHKFLEEVEREFALPAIETLTDSTEDGYEHLVEEEIPEPEDGPFEIPDSEEDEVETDNLSTSLRQEHTPRRADAPSLTPSSIPRRIDLESATPRLSAASSASTTSSAGTIRASGSSRESTTSTSSEATVRGTPRKFLPPPQFSISPWKTPAHSASTKRPRPSFLLSPTPMISRIRTTSQKQQETPNTSASVMLPANEQSMLKEVLPPFQSPWRKKTPKADRRRAVAAPRKSVLFGENSSFVRTPLKSGKRLSTIIPPINHGIYDEDGEATPRASLDKESIQVVRGLMKDSAALTPPEKLVLTPGRRLHTPSRGMTPRSQYKRTSPLKFPTASKPRNARAVEILDSEEELWQTDSDQGQGDQGWRVDNAEESSTPRAGTSARMTSQASAFADASPEMSMTLRDILLRAGEAGKMGAHGTFDFDLLDGEDGMVEGEETFDWR